MNYEQRNAVVAILTNLAVSSYIGWRTLEILTAQMNGAEGSLMDWAQLSLWAIPLSIVASVVGSILFNIIWSIATNTPKPSFVVDERDKQISIFAMRVTMVVASAGFIIATILLALGFEALLAFIVIYFGFALGDLAGNVSRVGYYQWGA